MLPRLEMNLSMKVELSEMKCDCIHWRQLYILANT